MEIKPNIFVPRASAHVGGRSQNSVEQRRMMWIGLGALTIGAVTGLLIARRKSTRRPLPDAAIWRQAFTEQHGPSEAAALIENAQRRYEELYFTRPHYGHPALRMHLEQNILPGLALYQVLLAEKGEQAAALAEVEMLLHAGAVRSSLRKATAALKYLPEPFLLMRLVTRAAMKYGFPAAGWETEWIEDSSQRVAFNIHCCFYLNTLTTYGAPELTRLFCEGDDVVYEALPPSIRRERTGTLARGYAVCDFCYRHVA